MANKSASTCFPKRQAKSLNNSIVQGESNNFVTEQLPFSQPNTTSNSISSIVPSTLPYTSQSYTDFNQKSPSISNFSSLPNLQLTAMQGESVSQLPIFNNNQIVFLNQFNKLDK